MPFLGKRLTDPESGEVVEAERLGTAARVEAALASAAEIRPLHEPNLAYCIVAADRGARWPRLIHRRTGVATRLVARAETVELARTIADLLNRIESQKARDSVGKRFTFPF